MENDKRYNHLNEYLKGRYGERTLKICVDGDFTCPNRDGKVSTGGCIYCSERGSGDHINKISIPMQISNYLNSYRGERANSYIVYFQNFSGTYGSIQDLKQKYDSAINCFKNQSSKRLHVLAVATRPDCINEEICKLLSSYKDIDVWVELGLQTSNDKTAELINRGYPSAVFTQAVKLLRQYNIEVITHIMIGLPGETHTDLENTIKFINNHDVQGIKIHSTYVVKNTILEEMYKENKYQVLELDDYIKETCFAITHIRPDIIIHKISGDAPKYILVAPSWNSHKKWTINGINKYLNENDNYQGQFI